MEKAQLLDREAIGRRFFSCFQELSPTELSKCFAVTPPTVFQWRSGHRHVPWEKLKYAVDVKGVRWDWLLSGLEPKRRSGGAGEWSPEFDWMAINNRFLSLFLDMPQREVGKLLNVTQGAFSSWNNNRRHVPWEKLHWAVRTMDVSWQWLLEGRE